MSIGTLIRDGDKYRAWGPCWWENSRGFCYLESSDGLNWQRPELGVVDYQGRKTNLIDFAFG